MGIKGLIKTVKLLFPGVQSTHTSEMHFDHIYFDMNQYIHRALRLKVKRNQIVDHNYEPVYKEIFKYANLVIFIIIKYLSIHFYFIALFYHYFLIIFFVANLVLDYWIWNFVSPFLEKQSIFSLMESLQLLNSWSKKLEEPNLVVSKISLHLVQFLWKKSSKRCNFILQRSYRLLNTERLSSFCQVCTLLFHNNNFLQWLQFFLLIFARKWCTGRRRNQAHWANTKFFSFAFGYIFNCRWRCWYFPTRYFF